MVFKHQLRPGGTILHIRFPTDPLEDIARNSAATGNEPTHALRGTCCANCDMVVATISWNAPVGTSHISIYIYGYVQFKYTYTFIYIYVYVYVYISYIYISYIYMYVCNIYICICMYIRKCKHINIYIYTYT